MIKSWPLSINHEGSSKMEVQNILSMELSLEWTLRTPKVTDLIEANPRWVLKNLLPLLYSPTLRKCTLHI